MWTGSRVELALLTAVEGEEMSGLLGQNGLHRLESGGPQFMSLLTCWGPRSTGQRSLFLMNFGRNVLQLLERRRELAFSWALRDKRLNTASVIPPAGACLVRAGARFFE